jgi:hypothetical protein
MTRTALVVRPIRAPITSSGSVPSNCSSAMDQHGPWYPGRRYCLRFNTWAVFRRPSTCARGSGFPRMASAPASDAAWISRRLPSGSARATPRARRHHAIVFTPAPHQWWSATADSQRMARASSSSTRMPEPPRPLPRGRQRGQEMRASVQLVTTTSQSRTKQKALSPRLNAGERYGPNSSLTRSRWCIVVVQCAYVLPEEGGVEPQSACDVGLASISFRC